MNPRVMDRNLIHPYLSSFCLRPRSILFSDAVYIYRKPSEGHCKVLFISGNRLDYTFAISLLSVNFKFRFEHS